MREDPPRVRRKNEKCRKNDKAGNDKERKQGN